MSFLLDVTEKGLLGDWRQSRHCGAFRRDARGNDWDASRESVRDTEGMLFAIVFRSLRRWEELRKGDIEMEQRVDEMNGAGMSRRDMKAKCILYLKTYIHDQQPRHRK